MFPYKHNFLFAALQSFYWCASCMTSTYLVLYLKQCGYDTREIGALLSAGSGTFLAGQFFWASYCYRLTWLSHKSIIIGCLITAIVVNLVIPLANTNYLVTLVFYSFFTFTFSSAAPMIDAWTMFRKHDTPGINFGATRGIGSGAYALAAVGFGSLFSTIGLIYMFAFAILFILLAITAASFIDRGTYEESRTASEIAGYKALIYPLRNLHFVALFISVFVVFTAQAANTSYYGLLITELGGSSRDFGSGIFLAAMSEVPVMLLSPWMLTSFSARKLLLLSLGFYVLKAYCFAVADSITLSILAQLAQSFSFGLFLPVTVAYLTTVVRKSQITVAYMLIHSACYGFGGIVGNALGGHVSQIHGLRMMYTVNLYITITGLVVFAASVLFVKPKPFFLTE